MVRCASGYGARMRHTITTPHTAARPQRGRVRRSALAGLAAVTFLAAAGCSDDDGDDDDIDNPVDGVDDQIDDGAGELQEEISEEVSG